ncbi:MAG: deoxyribose-phosphate aldolase [Phycisphaerae bacterium]
MSPRELARRIDHTILKPEATCAQVDKLCDEAREFGFVAVCVNPCWVELCARRLAGSATSVCTVAGFPLGASISEAKAFEARRAVEQGALEVDMVVNLADLITGDHKAVTRDIEAVVAATKRANEHAIVKVILETRALTEEQIIMGCRCVAEAQADFVKTSTGFHANGGATVEHVALLRRHSAPIKVKAAGGIRDLKTALAMIEAGADRLGMSASAAVMQELAATA